MKNSQMEEMISKIQKHPTMPKHIKLQIIRKIEHNFILNTFNFKVVTDNLQDETESYIAENYHLFEDAKNKFKTSFESAQQHDTASRRELLSSQKRELLEAKAEIMEELASKKQRIIIASK